MAQQLTLDLDNDKDTPNTEFMLWFEKSKASPEQAIKNACRYFREKYGKPGRVVLPTRWKGNAKSLIETEPLEEVYDMAVETNKTVLPKHVAIYPAEK